MTGIVNNNPLRLTDADGNLLAFSSPQEGLAEWIRRNARQPFDPLLDGPWLHEEMREAVRELHGPPPPGTANGDWLDEAVYQSAISLAKPLRQSRTIRGSLLSGLSALSAAIIQVSQDFLPQAITASQSVEAVWPQAVRWVLIAICLAGAWMSYSARRGAREEGMR